ncbi:Gldg family protein [Oscillatoria sp. FACHB-1407]|nr:Gldg family protein [Oscillatoria sp. FACHB-1407]
MSVLQRKYLKYLVWVGPMLIIIGLTAGVVANSWGAVPLGLMLVGIAILVVWLISEGSSVQGFFGRRSTQASTNALVATLAVLVILGLLNFLAVRYSARIDLTENQIFTLAPQSQEVLQRLEEPVKAWVFDPAENPQDRQLLENYRRQNDQFSYEYVNPNAQPGLAQEFGVGAPGEVYLEQGDRRRLLQVVNDQERLSERRLTNGIAQITGDRQAKVYFLQGHGERPLEAPQGGITEASTRLQEESYVTEPLNLAEQGDVPEDASAVVVAGPERALLEEEVAALEEYLNEGRGGLVLLIDPSVDPELTALLEDWGVTLIDRVIVDPARQATGPEALVALITQYGDHPITRNLGNGISFYPIARPIDLQPVEGVESVPLLATGDRVQAQSIDENGQLAFNPETDPEGQLLIGAALSRPVETDAPDASPSPEASPSPGASPSPSPSPAASPDEIPGEARLVVIGNSSFITDGLFNQQLNADVFLNSVSWVSQQENNQVLAVRPKEMTNRRILLQPQRQILLALLSLVFLPLLGFGMGIAVWWARR